MGHYHNFCLVSSKSILLSDQLNTVIPLILAGEENTVLTVISGEEKGFIDRRHYQTCDLNFYNTQLNSIKKASVLLPVTQQVVGNCYIRMTRGYISMELSTHFWTM